jgi:hypothetical protein
MRQVFIMTLCGFILPTSALSQTSSPPIPIEATAQINGSIITVDVKMDLDENIDFVWSVITDYQNAATYISNLVTSQEEPLSDNTKRVTQIGKVGWGIFSSTVKTVYIVKLNPNAKTVVGSLQEGDILSMLMKSSLHSIGPRHTKLLYSVEIEPAFYVPKNIAKDMLLSNTRQSFSDLAAEIKRRGIQKVSAQ